MGAIFARALAASSRWEPTKAPRGQCRDPAENQASPDRELGSCAGSRRRAYVRPDQGAFCLAIGSAVTHRREQNPGLKTHMLRRNYRLAENHKLSRPAGKGGHATGTLIRGRDNGEETMERKNVRGFLVRLERYKAASCAPVDFTEAD